VTGSIADPVEQILDAAQSGFDLGVHAIRHFIGERELISVPMVPPRRLRAKWTRCASTKFRQMRALFCLAGDR
jgi:hypothetical protein